jgi:hypothetical protein
VHTDSVQPGIRLAGRYRLDERMQNGEGTAFWRATDEVLRRPVAVRTLGADSAHAGALVSAARAASLVSDPRFLHVLDVSDQDSPDGAGRIIYVVSEWAQGPSLGSQLRAEGPLNPEEARRITQEVAQALALISGLGLAHRAVNPECVLRTDTGSVKLVGLGVDAAVAGLDMANGTDGAAADARSVGALLYAALTARWPGGAAYGLPAAPTEHGHLCTPRQVRAGVPADLDAVAERALSDQPRHGPPLRTPADIAASLSGNGYRGQFAGRTVQFEAPLARMNPEPAREPVSWPGRLTAIARAVAALLLVSGVVLIGWQLAGSGISPGESDQPDGTNTPPGGRATARLLPIEQASDFDPEGADKGEHPQEAARAIDDDPISAWHTQSYRQSDIGNKSGVGLLLDLGSVRDVRQVTVHLIGTGSDVDLLASESLGEQAGDYRKVAEASEVGESVELSPTDPIRARYVVVWLTKLPADSAGDYRGGIADVKVRG